MKIILLFFIVLISCCCQNKQEEKTTSRVIYDSGNISKTKAKYVVCGKVLETYKVRVFYRANVLLENGKKLSFMHQRMLKKIG